MAASLNKVELIGNVGKDPEIRAFGSDNKKIATFTVATSEKWRGKDGEPKEKTEWHRIAVWAQPLVNVVEKYVKKGTKLYLEGALQTRKWTDQAGVERYTTEIVLQSYNSTLILLDSRPGAGGSDAGYDNKSPSFFPSDDTNFIKDEPPMDDDIPF